MSKAVVRLYSLTSSSTSFVPTTNTLVPSVLKWIPAGVALSDVVSKASLLPEYVTPAITVRFNNIMLRKTNNISKDFLIFPRIYPLL